MANSKKVILITGCSSGFGLLTAARLAARGHHVIATMRTLEKQGALLSEVNRRGGRVDVMPLDVTDLQSIEDCVKEVLNKYDRIDVLVNNAGYGIGGAFEDLSDAEIRAQMETNFFGVQHVTRKVLPIMRQYRQGKIINISSVVGFSSPPCFGAYAASKWALEAFSESLYYEVAPFGINVALIQPGSYKTPIFYENRKESSNFDNEDSPYYKMSRGIKARVMDYMNNDCHKDTEEVAELIEKIINKTRPSFRHIPDLESQALYLVRKFLPFSFFSWATKRFCNKAMSEAASNNTVSQQHNQPV